MRPFTVPDSDGAAINLYNVASGRLIENAPTKSQCSRDYFYGEDGVLEKHLSRLERIYARVVQNLLNDASLTDDELLALRNFVLFQMNRTVQQVERVLNGRGVLQHAVDKYLERKHTVPALTQRQALMIALKSGIASLEYASDLKVKVLFNSTKQEFVLADEPAVITNKFLRQRKRQETYGLMSAGILLLMPISPKHQLCAYDSQVYTLTSSTITRANDVEALNEIQILNARSNIYFKGQAAGQQLKLNASHIRSEPKKISISEVFVEDPNVPGRYTRATSPANDQSRMLVSMGFVYPNPSNWPSFLKYRPKPIAYHNGSAVGYIRNPRWFLGRPRS